MRLHMASSLALLLAFQLTGVDVRAQESAESEVAETQDDSSSTAADAQSSEDPSDDDGAVTTEKAKDKEQEKKGGGGKMTAGLVAGLGSACLCVPIVTAMGFGPILACLAGPSLACLGLGFFAPAGLVTANLFNGRETTLRSLLLPSVIGAGSGFVLTLGSLLAGSGILGIPGVATIKSDGAVEWNATAIGITAGSLALGSLLGAAVTGFTTGMLYDDGSNEEDEIDQEKKPAKHKRNKKHKKTPKKPAKPKPESKSETQQETTPQNVPGPDTGFYY